MIKCIELFFRKSWRCETTSKCKNLVAVYVITPFDVKFKTDYLNKEIQFKNKKIRFCINQLKARLSNFTSEDCELKAKSTNTRNVVIVIYVIVIYIVIWIYKDLKIPQNIPVLF